MSMVLCTALPSTVSAQQTHSTGQNLEPAAAALALNLPGRLPESVRVVPERNFGYTIGDVLTQHISLPDAYTQTELHKLTTVTRVSTWLERQAASMTPSANGHRTLTLRYQIINAPLSIIGAALPELTLTPSSGEPVTIAAWPFTLGPLTASVSRADLALADNTIAIVDGNPLQADRTLPPLDDSTPAARLRLALLLLALTLLSWTGWYFWRNYRDKVRLPFAQALHSFRSCKQRKPGNTDILWKALHHAFNQSAGTVVNTSTIDALIHTHDWLRPLEPRIRSFYTASAARHYALPPRDEPFPVEELARKLADCERRNSR